MRSLVGNPNALEGDGLSQYSSEFSHTFSFSFLFFCVLHIHLYLISTIPILPNGRPRSLRDTANIVS